MRKSTGRAARGALSLSSQKVADLSAALVSLKKSFDSGLSLQNVFVSSRTLEEVTKLSALNTVALEFKILTLQYS
jgi:hypothetical protein